MNEVTPQNWISSLLKSNVAFSDLDIFEIVEISVKQLKNLRERYTKDELNEETYCAQSNEIAHLTSQLIATEEKDRNLSFKRTLKKFLLAISCLVIIGIPFYLKFYKEDQKFKDNIQNLKEILSETNEGNSFAIILKKIKQIPLKLEEIKKKFKDERRLELINDQIYNDWKEFEAIPLHIRPPYDEEFEKDFQKGSSFKRIDRCFHIEDTFPIPPQEMPANQRAQQADLLLRELLKTPEDDCWKTVLQIVVTRACLFTAFKAVVSSLNIDEACVQWEEHGHFHSIKSILSDQTAPIILEILRHPQKKNIELVNVTMDGNIDIVRYNPENNVIEKMIAPAIVTEELRFTIAFIKERPVVTHLQTQLRVNVPQKD